MKQPRTGGEESEGRLVATAAAVSARSVAMVKYQVAETIRRHAREEAADAERLGWRRA